MTTVRAQFPLIRGCGQTVTGLVPATTYTLKTGAAASERINDYNLIPLSEVCNFDCFGLELADDKRRLERIIHPLNLKRIVMGSEGDVRVLYFRYISHLLTLACPELQERAETGPIQQSDLATTVDSRFTFKDRQALTVELKRPKTINIDEWNEASNTSIRRKLSQEIRM